MKPAPFSLSPYGNFVMLPGIIEILMSWGEVTERKRQRAKFTEAANHVHELHDYALTLPESSHRENVLRAIVAADRVLSRFRGEPAMDVSGKAFAEYLRRPAIQIDLKAAYEKTLDARIDFAKMEAISPTADDPALQALTPNEQAIFDTLTNEPMTGPDIIAKLAREGITSIDKTSLSKVCRKPHMRARGVRNRVGAGYYVTNSVTT